MSDLETPILHGLPEGVPLVASFHDDRNRLSYYEPILTQLNGLQTPETEYFKVEGGSESFYNVEYRDITAYMQSLDETTAFLRSDFASAKFDPKAGSKITSQDPYDIEQTALELFTQLSLGKRYIGGKIAVREWVDHDIEVRYFVRGGETLYSDSTDDIEAVELPNDQAEIVAQEFDTFAWSVDFIRECGTGEWYAIDMGLDGLYPGKDSWVAISEHLIRAYSPERHTEDMPSVDEYDHKD